MHKILFKKLWSYEMLYDYINIKNTTHYLEVYLVTLFTLQMF